jgi:hypothetical protein
MGIKRLKPEAVVDDLRQVALPTAADNLACI